MTSEEVREQEKLLQVKVQLAEQMLEITKEYSDFLAQVTSTDDASPVIERTVKFLEERAKLMARIDEIAKEQQALFEDSISRAAVPGDLENRFREILRDLLELQSSVDAKLKGVQEELRIKIGKTKRSRQMVKGYYNQEWAMRPRFVDDKR